jgi:hypothetical protein
LLGLNNALDVRVVANEANDRVVLVASLPLTEIAKGARAVTTGDLSEILRLSPSTPVSPAPTSSPDLR